MRVQFCTVLLAKTHIGLCFPPNHTQVGFVIGPKPAGMSTRMRRSDSSGELALAWAPCDADIGSHVAIAERKVAEFALEISVGPRHVRFGDG